MKNFVLFLLSILVIIQYYSVYKKGGIIEEALQASYFLGQVDALNGRVRVDKDKLEWIHVDSLMIEQKMDRYPTFVYGKSKVGKKMEELAKERDYFKYKK